MSIYEPVPPDNLIASARKLSVVDDGYSIYTIYHFYKDQIFCELFMRTCIGNPVVYGLLIYRIEADPPNKISAYTFDTREDAEKKILEFIPDMTLKELQSKEIF